MFTTPTPTTTTSNNDPAAAPRRIWETIPPPPWVLDPTEDLLPLRRRICFLIETLLRRTRPNPDPQWEMQIPGICRRLETKLYETSTSREEYANEPTLKERLQRIATQFKQPATPAAAASTAAPQPQPSPPQPQRSSSTSHLSPRNAFVPIENPQTPHYPTPPTTAGFPPAPPAPPQQSSPPATTTTPLAPPPPAPPDVGDLVFRQQQIIMHQQQRLLLLRHASKCRAERGRCRETPYCADVKELLAHLTTCKETDCKFPHCGSSRFVLQHYDKCLDSNCQICRPVREMIEHQKVLQRQLQQQGMTPPTIVRSLDSDAAAAASQPVPPSSSPSAFTPYYPDTPNANKLSISLPAGFVPPPINTHTISTPHGISSTTSTPQLPSKAPMVKHNSTLSSGTTVPMLAGFVSPPMTPRDTVMATVPTPSSSAPPPPLASTTPRTSHEAPELVSAITLGFDRDNMKPVERAVYEYVNHVKAMKHLIKSVQEKTHTAEETAARVKKAQEGLLETQKLEAATIQKLEAEGRTEPSEMITAMKELYRLKIETFMADIDANRKVQEAIEAELHSTTLVKDKNLRRERELKNEIVRLTGSMEEADSAIHQAVQRHNQYVQLQQQQMRLSQVDPALFAQQRQPATQQHRNAPPQPTSSSAPGARYPQQQSPTRPLARTGSSSTDQQQRLPSSTQTTQLYPSMPQPIIPLPTNSIFHAGAVPKTIQYPFRTPEQQTNEQQQQLRPPKLTNQMIENSLINQFDRRTIELHIASLTRPVDFHRGESLKMFRSAALQLWKSLSELPDFAIFKKPVDPVELGIPTYLEVITKPMDLGTVKQKLDPKHAHHYRKFDEFVDDVRLTFQNAITFNDIDSDVGKIALDYARLFEKELVMTRERNDEEALSLSYRNDVCRLCCQGTLEYDPPEYACEGEHCDGSAIKRNAFMYKLGVRAFCELCFKFDPGEVWLKVSSDGTKIAKKDLTKVRNDEVSLEEWVFCLWCRRRYHVPCAMLRVKPMDVHGVVTDQFLCPLCVLRSLDDARINCLKPEPSDANKELRATSLKETLLSQHLEQRVNEMLQRDCKKRAETEKVDVKDFDEVGQVTVRVVMCKDTELVTRDGIIKLYGGPPHNYPQKFPMRQKAVLAFERIDGLDVLLFIMFLQYYGSESPAPNNRSLYIAYIDSVNYFRPSELRTPLYHELIIATLEYERKQGFTRCFIWACPPQHGDDYIFNCHPKNQRTPDRVVLRNWYLDLLEEARQRGVIVSTSTLYDEYFQRVPDVTMVPYFEGDWWQAYGETYITDLQRDGTNPRALQATADAIKVIQEARLKILAKERKSKRSRKSGEDGIIFYGGGGGSGLLNGDDGSTSFNLPSDDEDDDAGEWEAQRAGGLPQARCPQPRLPDQVPHQDLLTAKISSENRRMGKRDFIVVKMFHDCAECGKALDQPGDLYWVPNDYDPATDPHNPRRLYAPAFCMCHDCYVQAYAAEYGGELPQVEEGVPMPAVVGNTNNNSNGHHGGSLPGGGSSTSAGAGAGDDVMEDIYPQPVLDHSTSGSTLPIPPVAQPSQPANANGGGGLMTRRKRRGTATNYAMEGLRDLDSWDSSGGGGTSSEKPVQVLPPGVMARAAKSWLTPPCSLKQMHMERADIKAEIKDPDPIMESEVFDTRRGFLGLCQQNRYQFDELRRAKYSTSMLLYHLHHNDSVGTVDTELVYTCDHCNVTISMERFSCTVCESFDLCGRCNRDAAAVHPHPLQRFMIDDTQRDATQQNTATSPNASLPDVVHVSSCRSMSCPVPNCAKFKKWFSHLRQCMVKDAVGGCHYCKRLIQYIYQGHTRSCRTPNCPVMYCEALKRQANAARQQANAAADRRALGATTRVNPGISPRSGGVVATSSSSSSAAAIAAAAAAAAQMPQWPGGSAAV